jgi:hypothetical protein
MANDESLGGPVFWYYALLAVILIIIGFAIILPGASSRSKDPCDEDQELGWPSNLNMWRYYPSGIIPYLVWAATVIIFMVGAYMVDKSETSNQNITFYRNVFFLVVILDLVSLWLFFWLHNVKGFIAAKIFILVLVLGLILIYTKTNINDTWFAVPYFMIQCYFTYMALYLLNNNDDSTLHNSMFEL